MNTTTRKHTIAALLLVIGAVLILGGTAQAATPRPAGMSNAEYGALMIRSEALNEKYHLGRYSRTPQGTTAAAYRALMIRSEALNEKYHLGAFAPATRGLSAGAGFSWSAFGIGAAAMFGLVLLASGAIAGGRHGWRTPQTRITS
jgi:hypothetical protein